MVMPDNRLLALEKKMSGTNDNSQCEVESKGEKYISKLKKRGEAHLIVSALITTVTFAAGFTFPGGYKEDEGMAILTKKIAFKAFVATDTIAMVFLASAIFFHFLMKMHNEEDVIEKHLVWALRLTMLGMGAMVIAFAIFLTIFLVSQFVSYYFYLVYNNANVDNGYEEN
ncbi:protein ACCELERATED CELL DEATH 6-like [Vitis riparia]|uniref:protein ACCELERATED CELL DEATH 6-like n=1 Tax=Vitis riparia TaxID=96939 RepID=UPI00155A6D86|nr:protein ACCELERATED CELL DEATH 6-like [Vitis riparia]